MTFIHQTSNGAARNETAEPVDIETVIDEAVAAIIKIELAGRSATPLQREALALAAARIDDVLASAVRTIHGPDQTW